MNASTQNNAGNTKLPVKGRGLLLLLVLLSLLAGLQAATQFFAFNVNYHATLGPNLNGLYTPWSILLWAQQWYSQYPEPFMKAAGIGMLATVVGLVLAFLVKTLISNSASANATLHGSARWATKKDIQAAGLLPANQKGKSKNKGNNKKEIDPFVYVGGFEDKDGTFYYLRHSGPEHILCYAPTRSGKGVGLVVPTLLSWYKSAVITDLKGELWALTAGWRQQHANNKVLRFEPASSDKGVIRWNPLDEIRFDEPSGEFNVGDVQNLATLIVDPDGKGLDSHWQKTAFALLVGVILHRSYTNSIFH